MLTFGPQGDLTGGIGNGQYWVWELNSPGPVVIGRGGEACWLNADTILAASADHDWQIVLHSRDKEWKDPVIFAPFRPNWLRANNGKWAASRPNGEVYQSIGDIDPLLRIHRIEADGTVIAVSHSGEWFINGAHYSGNYEDLRSADGSVLALTNGQLNYQTVMPSRLWKPTFAGNGYILYGHDEYGLVMHKADDRSTGFQWPVGGHGYSPTVFRRGNKFLMAFSWEEGEQPQHIQRLGWYEYGVNEHPLTSLLATEPYDHPVYVAPFFLTHPAYGAWEDKEGNCEILWDVWQKRKNPPRAVIAPFNQQAVIDSIPKEYLKALYIGTDRLFINEAEWQRDFVAAGLLSAALNIPLCVYYDQYTSTDAYPEWFVGKYLRPNKTPAISFIPLVSAYPYKHDLVESTEATIERVANTCDRLRQEFPHVGLVRPLYTQSGNWPLQSIIDLQPLFTSLVNHFALVIDAPFAFGRESGITTHPELSDVYTRLTHQHLEEPILTNPQPPTGTITTYGPLVGEMPLKVTANASVTGVVTNFAWLWRHLGEHDWHTEQITTDTKGVYTFTEPGVFEIALTVTGPNGSNTTGKQRLVTVKEAQVPPQETPVGRAKVELAKAIKTLQAQLEGLQ